MIEGVEPAAPYDVISGGVEPRGARRANAAGPSSRTIWVSIVWLSPSIADRDADRSGGAAGIGRVALPIRESGVFDGLGGVDLVREDPGDVAGVDALGGSVGAQFVELLLHAGGILDGSVRAPLDGGHRLGDLQPLRGSVDQLGERAGGVGPRCLVTNKQRGNDHRQTQPLPAWCGTATGAGGHRALNALLRPTI